jgi:hypothetical protein
MNDELDYDLYYLVIQLLIDTMWRDQEDLEIGRDISDIPAVKIIFDGYGDLEDEDENGEYRYTEGGNKNMESYALFIHKDSAQPDFVFPEHELSPWCLIHRPAEEVCIHIWYDVENDEWSINSLDETMEHEMTDAEVIEILKSLEEQWFKDNTI